MNLRNRRGFLFGVGGGGGRAFELAGAGGSLGAAGGGGGGVNGTLLAGIALLESGMMGTGAPGDTAPIGGGSFEALL